MRRVAASLALAALATTAAAAQEREPRSPPPEDMRRAFANPSAVIAAEIAFARLAREKGQWTAFRETAGRDAVMFERSMVLAQPWLKGRANPASALRWQPQAVWSSCDGSLMVSTGAWQSGAESNGGGQGWFTTVWQRQEKGDYKWVLHVRDGAAQPLAAPDMISARVADCAMARRPEPPAAKGRREGAAPLPFDPARREGGARDGTLRWRVTVAPGGAPAFFAEMAQDGAMRPVREERVPPAP